MTTTPRALGALALVLALGAGCSDDDGESQPDAPASTPTSTSSADEGRATPEPEEPSVAPAAGEPVERPSYQLRLPDGWRSEESILSGDSLWAVTDDDALAELSATTFEMDWNPPLKETLKYGRGLFEGEAKVRRGPDTEVAGVPAYTLLGTLPNTTRVTAGALHEGRLLVITIAGRQPLADNQRLLDSVLASVVWP